MSDASPSSLRVLTLNCWGLKFLAKHRNARLSEIGHALSIASPPLDIVGLQECWTREDYDAIRDATSKILPHGKFYHSGIFGGGLVILSRWPIEESSMVRYPLNGRPTAFFRGDWFVGKGVACARIRMGPSPGETVEVFCTHLHAPYESEPNDSYICHRTAQAWEIAKLMRGAAEKGHMVLGLGDFNMIPLSLAHRLIEAHSPVRDVWRVLHPDSAIGAARDKVEQKRGVEIPTTAFNITHNGATCDSPMNTWRWDKASQKRLDKGHDTPVDSEAQDPRGKRLDYIFFAPGSGGPNNETWQIQSAEVGMMQRHSTLKCSLSDHFSVEATLVRSNTPSSMSNTPTTPSLPASTYQEIQRMIATYDLRERRQRRLRLGHFGGQLFISIGCLIAVWWSPANFVSFILMLLSTLGLGAGIIDGLIGGLFVGSEIRALKEFEWEINAATQAAVARGQSDE